MAANPWIPLIEITGTFSRPEELPELNAEQLIEKATRAFDSGKNEFTYGETISDLLSNENGLQDCQRSLANIGVWHLECSVEFFLKAIRNFERALKLGLSKELNKKVETQLKECKKQLTAAAKQKNSALDSINLIGEQTVVQKATAF